MYTYFSTLRVERKEEIYMYLTVKQQVKHLSKQEYLDIKELCHVAKNLTNEAIYNIRQYYFDNNEYLSYEKNYKLLKSSDNYKILNSNMAQQILKEVDGSFRAFFSLLRLAKQGKYNYKDIRLPHYLPKDSFTTLVIGFIRIKDNKLLIPFSNLYKKTHKPISINMPPILADKKIKEIRIIPKVNARFFEIQYTYEECIEQKKLNKDKALAIDLGINNLCTCVTSNCSSFIIDGKRLKSINQWYNKENAKLQSIKDKQGIDNITLRQSIILNNRNNKLNDYMNKAARYIVDYCINNDIGNIVVGYNDSFQKEVSLNKTTKQSFLNIPYGKLIYKLEYLSKLYGINIIKQEESYTSKASFFDKDNIPIYCDNNHNAYSFSGQRIKRGLYKTGTNKLINADINGALNIMRKSSVVDINILYSRGEVDTPIRIRIA